MNQTHRDEYGETCEMFHNAKPNISYEIIIINDFTNRWNAENCLSKCYTRICVTIEKKVSTQNNKQTGGITTVTNEEKQKMKTNKQHTHRHPEGWRKTINSCFGYAFRPIFTM